MKTKTQPNDCKKGCVERLFYIDNTKYIFPSLKPIGITHPQIRRDGSVDLEDKSRLSAEKAKQIIKNTLGDYIASQLQSLGKEERDWFLRQLKRIEGLSIRQIVRITGFTFNVVAKA
ncbi:hypothetical protein [Sporomusa carbonis]|uniref:hypothetical protein n=1 Tax=Sporomusa carbonis TaxID=3076075 RepID=UPI003C79E570